MLTAQAEAEKIRFIGEAEAASIEAVGKAEAEKMRLKAEAYQQYGEAAKTALVLEALPKVCGTRLHTTDFKRSHQHLGSLAYWSDYPVSSPLEDWHQSHLCVFFTHCLSCEC